MANSIIISRKWCMDVICLGQIQLCRFLYHAKDKVLHSDGQLSLWKNLKYVKKAKNFWQRIIPHYSNKNWIPWRERGKASCLATHHPQSPWMNYWKENESKVSKRRLTDTKKNETRRMISRANCNTMFLFFLTADNQISRNVHSWLASVKSWSVD